MKFRFTIISFFFAGLGFFQGYYIASLNYQDVIDDIYRVVEENDIKNKSKVDEFINSGNKDLARKHINDLKKEYEELYN